MSDEHHEPADPGVAAAEQLFGHLKALLTGQPCGIVLMAVITLNRQVFADLSSDADFDSIDVSAILAADRALQICAQHFGFDNARIVLAPEPKRVM